MHAVPAACRPIPQWEAIINTWLHLPIPAWYWHYLCLHPEEHQAWGSYPALAKQQRQRRRRGRGPREGSASGGRAAGAGETGAAQPLQPPAGGGWGAAWSADPERWWRQQQYVAQGLVEEGDWLVGAKEHGAQPGRLYPRIRWDGAGSMAEMRCAAVGLRERWLRRALLHWVQQ